MKGPHGRPFRVLPQVLAAGVKADRCCPDRLEKIEVWVAGTGFVHVSKLRMRFERKPRRVRVPGDGLLDIRGLPYPPESGGSLVRHVLRRTSGVVPQGRVQAAAASTRGRPLQQCVFDGFEHAFQILANRARNRSRAASLSLPKIVLCPAPSSSTPRRHSVQ